MELYVLALAGVLVHFLKKIHEARELRATLDYVLEGISLIISIIIVMALIFSKEDLENIYTITKLSSFILGYVAQSVFRALVNSYNSKTVLMKASTLGGHPDPDKEEK